MTKQQWRQEFKTRLANLNGHSLFEHDLANQVRHLLKKVCAAGNWGGYMALPQEPRLSFLSIFPDCTWYYPRILGQDLSYHLPENYVTHPWGLTEPSQQAASIKTSELRGVFVPGLGFDRLGFRLGRGKGFFDRALIGFKGLKIGVGFEACLVDQLPHDSWDLPMDVVVTERGCLWKP